jgi:hypothetical protein
MKPKKTIKRHHINEVNYTESLWQELSNAFDSHNKKNRSFANWIITSPDIARIINNIENRR